MRNAVRVSKGDGFALVLTLVMITVIAVLAAAFLSQLQYERATAQAFYDAARADLAVDAAIQRGMAEMQSHWARHPDAATAWGELKAPAGDLACGATALYFRNGTARELWVQPLISGAVAKRVEDVDDSLSIVDASLPYSDAVNSVDINQAASASDLYGWIGSPRGGQGAQGLRRPVRVPWVEIVHPDDPTLPIGRYAFWIEDESFKLNLNRLGSTPRGAASVGETAEEIPLQGILKECGVAAGDVDEVAAEITANRSRMPGKQWVAVEALEQVNGAAAKFYLTPFSRSLNLTRSGAKRWNLNGTNWATSDGVEIRLQLDRMIAVINHESPDFGQRFYRLSGDLDAKAVSGVSPEHAAIYLQKIAANLRDYLAPAALPPTIVKADGSILIEARPERGIEPAGGALTGTNPVIAIGKKNLPYLQEVAMRVTLTKFDRITDEGVAAVAYDFYYDYYFEFWNMTARDIRVDEGDLGPNPTLLVYDQPAFNTSSATHIGTEIPAGRPFEIPLSGIVFPAGKPTVITTDTELNKNKALLSGGNAANVQFVAVPDEARRYQGKTFYATTGGLFRVNLIPRSTTTSSDYQTKVLIRNDLGLLDSICSLPLARIGSNQFALQIWNDSAGHPKDDMIYGEDREQYLVRGGSLQGNKKGVLSQTGDPRTTNEQLFLRIYAGSGDEQTRYYNSELDNVSTNGTFNVPAKSSLGAQNTVFVDPRLWPDPFEWSPTGIDTPFFIANAPMKSIGELGHLFDPARPLGPTGDIRYSRGGGRTLSIGQPDPLWSGERDSASREWAAWRLTDMFATQSAERLDGLVNLNGVLRDDGAALRAMLHGFQFSNRADVDPALSGSPISASTVEAMVSALKDRLAKAGTLGPLAERGELSEVMTASLFAADPTDGAPSPRYDRGREELFRRLVELTTTRGSVFTIYAMGQAVKQTPSGKKVYGAATRRKITFELIPVWEPALQDDFDPAVPAAVAARLRPPDRFKIEILKAAP